MKSLRRQTGSTQRKAGASVGAEAESASFSQAAAARSSTRSQQARPARADRAGRGASPRSSVAQTPKRPPVRLLVLAVVLLAAVLFAAQLCSSAAAITVTVNGSPYSLRGEKTLQVAIKESGLPINPGDLISLGGQVLQRGQGDPFYATVNDEEVGDASFKLRDGDVVTLTDGKDVVEPYDAIEEPVPYEVDVRGTGPIRTFTAGEDGVKEIRTGKISGEVVEKQTVDPVDLTETCDDPYLGDGSAKVIALTFDDGPSAAYTEDVLDVLAKYEAKATFFFAGAEVEADGGADIVMRAAEEGHQLCSHGYSVSSLSGTSLDSLSADEQVSEVERGYAALAGVLEGYSDRVVRLGNEAISKSALINVAEYVDCEVGWTLDTGDWVYMAEDDIYDVLMSAESGDIVRMHDGGDHQDATVKALKRALPKLKKKGFSFVTVDDMRSYSAE